MFDLDHATREDLIALVVAQREALADRDRQVAELVAGMAAERATQRAAMLRLTQRVGELLAAMARAGMRLDEDDPGDDGGAVPGERGGTTPRGMPGLKPTKPAAPRRDRGDRVNAASTASPGPGRRRRRGRSTPWTGARTAPRRWPGAP